jgi:alkanesulfonate monooxygenase SsuD/methylene tetrahydromethanopterin reductase-like flavin-dependent oxidoreductase (luciferase family)
MDVYHFSEQPYPDAWRDDLDSYRVTIPNRLCEPEVMSNLYNRYLDEWVLCDELGLNIMVNEHHATATCASSSANVTLAILARITKNARLLTLGTPICNRNDPVRVAEELSMIDVISKGRVNMGLVKGVPYEIAPTNSNPGRMMDRFWEAHDLILKAMTTHDGPFSWEGEYFHYRNVNIWPRPYQQPHPPVWITSLSPSSAPGIAKRGHVVATVLSGLACQKLFDAYRTAYLEYHGSPAPLDRFCYVMMGAVADSTEEAVRRAMKVKSYVASSDVVAPPFNFPPGYASPEISAKLLKIGGKFVNAPVKTQSGRMVDPRTASVEEMVDAGIMYAGTPDEVFNQLTSFYEAVGGFGNLSIMAQGGTLDHRETSDSLTLFGREVLPRFKEWAKAKEAAYAGSFDGALRDTELSHVAGHDVG